MIGDILVATEAIINDTMTTISFGGTICIKERASGYTGILCDIKSLSEEKKMNERKLMVMVCIFSFVENYSRLLNIFVSGVDIYISFKGKLL